MLAWYQELILALLFSFVTYLLIFMFVMDDDMSYLDHTNDEYDI